MSEVHPDLTVQEIALRHKLSRQTVTRLFKNERGVIVLPGGGPMRKHHVLRIPQAVYQRVLGRITKAIKKR
jgi:transcriptional regulator GlxA family with amidase domain